LLLQDTTKGKTLVLPEQDNQVPNQKKNHGFVGFQSAGNNFIVS